MKMHTIHPDGRVLSSASPAKWPALHGGIARMIGSPHLEMASVIFEGKPATLVVDETGASADSTLRPDGPLPPNTRATAIYWTATQQGITGVPFDPLRMPMIHGTAVLLEVDKRTL